MNTAHGCHYPGHIYQQLTTSDASFVPSTAPPSLENSPVNSRESTNGRAGNATARRNNVLSSARTGYRGYHSDRGILPIVSTQSSVSQDVRVGYEDGRIGAMSSDLPKATEIQQRHNNITSVGHNGRPMALLLVSDQDFVMHIYVCFLNVVVSSHVLVSILLWPDIFLEAHYYTWACFCENFALSL